MARDIRGRRPTGPRPKRRIKPGLLRRMRAKLCFVFGFVCVLLMALIVRLMYIQQTSGEEYEKIVLSQQQYDSSIIPYQRGDILDSKGTVLATSVDVYNVILDCKVLNANEEDIDTTVALVTEYFPSISAETIYNALENSPSSQYKVLLKQISYEEMAAFEEVMDSSEYSGQISGIWFEKEYTRTYPYGSLAASVLGFASSSDGVIGLELQYNNELNGTNGRSYGYYNSDGELEATIEEATNGYSLVTTLDVTIQSIVEDIIVAANEEMAATTVTIIDEETGEETTTTVASDELGSANTAVIVMDPNSGDILAMASYPGFDLNDPYDLTAYYSDEELATMTDDETMDILNSIWQNYTITSTFEPGSTFKPFTIAMGLDTGVLSGNETYDCQGSLTIGGWDIHCVNRYGHGVETISDALSNSCNVALMSMALSIGGSTFAKYQSAYGFGQKTGIDLPGEASTASLIYSAEELVSTTSNLATNSFGQNFNVTMIQLASAFCSLINGGDFYQPHIVSKIIDASGDIVEEISPVVLKQTVSDEVSEMMREYLYEVVNSGTGKKAAVEGYTIGGKTGTAEKLPRSEGNYLVSFIGFAPVDDPQVVVYVVVDEPNVDDQSSCAYAKTIASQIFEAILPYLGVEKEVTTDTESELEAEEDTTEEDIVENTITEVNITETTESSSESTDETTTETNTDTTTESTTESE